MLGALPPSGWVPSLFCCTGFSHAGHRRKPLWRRQDKTDNSNWFSGLGISIDTGRSFYARSLWAVHPFIHSATTPHSGQDRRECGGLPCVACWRMGSVWMGVDLVVLILLVQRIWRSKPGKLKKRRIFMWWLENNPQSVGNWDGKLTPTPREEWKVIVVNNCPFQSIFDLLIKYSIKLAIPFMSPIWRKVPSRMDGPEIPIHCQTLYSHVWSATHVPYSCHISSNKLNDAPN